jgi:polyhydroxyalkanoate synthesis regulator phasin
MSPDQERKIDQLIDKVDALLTDFRLWVHEVKRLRDRVAALESESIPPEAAE